MSSVYIDSKPFIYTIEGEPELADLLRELFAVLVATPGSATTSELTLAEVLPKAPSETHRRMYLDLIVWSGVFDLRPVSREILLETANYRRNVSTMLPDGRNTMPKLPDAIHIVTAIQSGCQMLLTADERLKLPAETKMKIIGTDRDSIIRLMRELA